MTLAVWNDERKREAIALFEDGIGAKATATRLRLPRGNVQHLHSRWRLFGQDALLMDPKRRTKYSRELKAEVVQRFLGGEATASELASEYRLPAPQTIHNWVREHRRKEPDEAVTRDCPPPSDWRQARVEGENGEDLRQENERLRAEVAYLKKLAALRNQSRQ